MEFKFKISLVENTVSIFQVVFEPTIHLTKSSQSYARAWVGEKKEKLNVIFPSMMTKHDMENGE